jgi:hypothetical protein
MSSDANMSTYMSSDIKLIITKLKLYSIGGVLRYVVPLMRNHFAE